MSKNNKDDSERKYVGFYGANNKYIGVLEPRKITDKLSPGFYDLKLDEQSGTVIFCKQDTNHDGLFRLPTQEFKDVVVQIETFLNPQTKKLFNDYGFLYKRSALLYGEPGTGKTCLVNQVADRIMELGGIVLFNPDTNILIDALEQIQQVQPEVPTLVVFEELDKLIEREEGNLLNILDGEIQKENIIYLATTNYINKIPPRLQRPGRFSSIVKVGTPSSEVRKAYLAYKGISGDEAVEWAEITDGFTVDELKETVLAVKCLGLPLLETVKKVKALHNEKDLDIEEDEDEADMYDTIELDDKPKKRFSAWTPNRNRR